jgi:hypothetical protein
LYYFTLSLEPLNPIPPKKYDKQHSTLGSKKQIAWPVGIYEMKGRDDCEEQ